MRLLDTHLQLLSVLDDLFVLGVEHRRSQRFSNRPRREPFIIELNYAIRYTLGKLDRMMGYVAVVCLVELFTLDAVAKLDTVFYRLVDEEVAVQKKRNQQLFRHLFSCLLCLWKSGVAYQGLLESRSKQQLVAIYWKISSNMLEQLCHRCLIFEEENHALSRSPSDSKLAIWHLRVKLSQFQGANHRYVNQMMRLLLLMKGGR